MPAIIPPTETKKAEALNTAASASTAHDVEKPSNQSVASATHSQKTEQELQAERLYEERMEEEYAKREGGA